MEFFLDDWRHAFCIAMSLLDIVKYTVYTRVQCAQVFAAFYMVRSTFNHAYSDLLKATLKRILKYFEDRRNK